MPARTDLKTIMVIGSGPIIIGQAGEFDYSGTQGNICQGGTLKKIPLSLDKKIKPIAENIIKIFETI